MGDQVTDDLNTVIATAVNARIESQVAAALAGDEFIGKYVSAALNRKVTVRDPGTYRDRETTFLSELLTKTIQSATEQAVRKLVVDEVDQIEIAVRKELKASTAAVAKQLVGSVSDAIKSSYGVTVELKFPDR